MACRGAVATERQGLLTQIDCSYQEVIQCSAVHRAAEGSVAIEKHAWADFLRLLAFQCDLWLPQIQCACNLGTIFLETHSYAPPCGASIAKMGNFDSHQILEIRPLIPSFLTLKLQALMYTTRQAAHEIFDG